MSKVNVTVGIDDRVVPSGGNENQVLAKNSNTDYDFKWMDASGSGGGGGVTPYAGIPTKDSSSGSTGQADGYARGDHFHPVNKSSNVLDVQMDGTANLGSSDYYALVDHVHPHDNYNTGFVLYESANIFNSVEDLPAAGTAGRIAFVKVS